MTRRAVETFVTGDAVNVAARLEQARGSPDEVLIGESTYRLVRGQRSQVERGRAAAREGQVGASARLPTAREISGVGPVPRTVGACPWSDASEELDAARARVPDGRRRRAAAGWSRSSANRASASRAWSRSSSTGSAHAAEPSAARCLSYGRRHHVLGGRSRSCARLAGIRGRGLVRRRAQRRSRARRAATPSGDRSADRAAASGSDEAATSRPRSSPGAIAAAAWRAVARASGRCRAQSTTSTGPSRRCST